jgi:hypothetical protein
VPPTADVRHDFLRDFACGQKQIEHRLFPQLIKTRTRGKSALAFWANRRFTLNQYTGFPPRSRRR